MAAELDTLEKHQNEKEGIFHKSLCDVGVQFFEITPMTGDLFNMTDVFLMLLLIHMFRCTTWSFNCWTCFLIEGDKHQLFQWKECGFCLRVFQGPLDTSEVRVSALIGGNIIIPNSQCC